MKAIRVNEFGTSQVLQLKDVPDPRPQKDQVVVRVMAAGVNPVDTYMRSGAYARKPDLPYTPGTDSGGVIEAVGPAVQRFKPGARVYTSGTISGSYAELALCEESQVHPLPANISFTQGAAVGIPYATAYRSLFQRARVEPGETVLVHGASGGVGIACVQLARAAGLLVLGTAGSDKGRGLVLKEGAHHVLDHGSSGYTDEIMAITRKRGVDVIMEMLANVNLAKDLLLLGRDGRVVVIGSRGTIEINPREAMSREAAILGMTLWGVGERDLHAIHAALVAGLENNTLNPVVGHELPLADAARAHDLVASASAYGKIVLVP
jgi:NADPH:quinone reductase